MAAPWQRRPGLLRPLHRFWMKLGHVLGAINSRIILGVLFFVLFVPAAIVMKLMRRDALARSTDPGARTYRVQRDGDVSDMRHPF